MVSFEWLSGTTDLVPRLPDALQLGILHFGSDVVIASCYAAVGAGVIWFLRQRPDFFAANRIHAWLCGVVILAGALSHLVDAVTIWHPISGFQGVVKLFTAVVSLLIVVSFWPLLPALVNFPSIGEMEEANRRLQHEVDAHQTTLRELATIHHELEQRVEQRTREVSEVKARFETALRGGKVYAFSQDRDLRYTWAYSPYGDGAISEMLGRTDEDVLPTTERESVVALKRRVLSSGKPADGEVFYPMPRGRALLSLHVEPTHGPDGRIEGITCAAIDISRLRSLESEQRRLAAEIRTALARYDIALRGSHVTVFTQDRNLRYTSISNVLFGRGQEELLGRADEETFGIQEQRQLVGLKRDVLESGEAKDGEISVLRNGVMQWYDVHLEPLPDLTGAIVGLAGAAVDITERKQSEAHLRLLMRELTHRSKNLLAVIQAMARQTARHVDSTDEFLEQFGARLQALAVSHDLLVQESWYGASLAALTRLQLGHYLDSPRPQISIDGPPVLLRPEAAQSLGLALHELATNAAKYGALSVPGGHVAIRWQQRGDSATDGVEISWAESQGPHVIKPERRGFGSLVVEKNLARALDADVSLDFDPDGVRCRIVIPPAHLLAGR
jgi:PAS domain S-box-containing protein